jgi:hypothetical protein
LRIDAIWMPIVLDSPWHLLRKLDVSKVTVGGFSEAIIAVLRHEPDWVFEVERLRQPHFFR